MRQLIDKTVLRKELSDLPSEMGFVRKTDVMRILGEQKCAYDIDKTIKELEALKPISVDVGFGTIYKTLIKDLILKIVKGGGVGE